MGVGVWEGEWRELSSNDTSCLASYYSVGPLPAPTTTAYGLVPNCDTGIYTFNHPSPRTAGTERRHFHTFTPYHPDGICTQEPRT
jgi:hypothetical protein